MDAVDLVNELGRVGVKPVEALITGDDHDLVVGRDGDQALRGRVFEISRAENRRVLALIVLDVRVKDSPVAVLG